MNIDTQEVNIVVDNDSTEVQGDIAGTRKIAQKLAENIDVGIQIEQTVHIEH